MLCCLLALLAAPPAQARPPEPGDLNAYQAPEHLPPACGARICVHWVESGVEAPPSQDLAPHNGIPDLVDTVLSDAEQDYQFQVGAEGWQAPTLDGPLGNGGSPANDDKVDVYIKQLSGAAGPDRLGATSGEINPQTQTAAGFILLNNSFTQELDLLSPEQTLPVVIAHEFNHVLQLGYTSAIDRWMAESTAEWMSFNQYPTLLAQEGTFSVWAASSTLPLAANSANGVEAPNVYGYAIWDWWLAGRYGASIVRNAWSDLRTVSPADYGVGAYDAAIRAAGGPGFSAEFARFAATSAEVNTAAFPLTDSVIYPDVRRHGELRVDRHRSLHLDHTSFALLQCGSARGGPIRKGRSLTLTARSRRGAYAAIALIGRTPKGRVKVALGLAPKGGRRSVKLSDPGRYRRITAALINADGSVSGGGPDTWSYRAEGVPFTAQLRVSTAGR